MRRPDDRGRETMMSNERIKPWGRIAIVAALLLLIGLVGTMDYQDEIAEENAYCQNVAEGIWPDYNGTYDRWCEDGRLR